jgi:SAM-dependent methyltransferase
VTTPHESRWASMSGGGGRRYAERFAALAAAGNDMHGEASFCAALVPPGSRVLDAGCGTGRVAMRLAELGYECVGVDSDASMLDVAREATNAASWQLLDLVDLGRLTDTFDLIVAAGNVIPLLAPRTEAAVIAGLADRLAPDGVLVTGFGLDAAHLPLPEAPFDLAEYDEWCVAAGLGLIARYSTWAGDPLDHGGYAVSVHHRAKPAGPRLD